MMVTISRWEKWVGLLTLTPLLLIACRPISEPEFKTVQNLRMVKLGNTESTVKMDVLFFNPNNKSFRIKESDLDIYVNESFAGHTSLDTVIEVPALSNFTVPVSVKMNSSNILKNAIASLFNPTILVKVNGSIKAGRNGLYRNFRVAYEGRQKIEW